MITVKPRALAQPVDRPSRSRWLGWYFRLDLWPRLALVVLAGFATLFSVIAVIALVTADELASEIYRERLVLTANTARQMDDMLAQALRELRQARELAELNPTAGDRSLEARTLALAYGRLGTFNLGVTWYDAEGRVVLSEPLDRSRIGRSELDLPYVAQAIQRGEPVIAGAVRPALSGRPAIAIAQPIVEGGRLIGVTSGLIALDGDAVKGVLVLAKGLGHSGHAQLVDAQGVVLASTEPWEHNQAGKHLDFYRRAARERRALVEVVPCDPCPAFEAEEGQHLMAYAPLQGAPWGVAVGGHVAESLAPVYTLRSRLLWAGLISLVVVFAATLSVARLLTRPIEALTAAAAPLAEGNLDQPIAVAESGEVSRLGLALERMRQQLQARTAQLERLNQERRSLLERMLSGQEDERRRIARELHDATSQTVASVVVGLRLIERSGDLDSAHQRAAELRQIALQAVESMRQLAADLRPSVLDDLGLEAAIRQQLQAFRRRFDIQAELEAALPPNLRLGPLVESALYRIVEGALSNVAQHADATQVWVTIGVQTGRLVLSVRDDGRGFEAERVLAGALERKLGLLGLQERAALIGADCEIRSRPGSGTSVTVSLSSRLANR